MKHPVSDFEYKTHICIKIRTAMVRTNTCDKAWIERTTLDSHLETTVNSMCRSVCMHAGHDQANGVLPNNLVYGTYG